jgi:hypothetical protein
MNSSSFLRADGTLAPPRYHWWTNWLPKLDQIQQAIQLHFEPLPANALESQANALALSMRQGMGLVIVAALLAGLIPFLVNTTIALRAGAPLPLIQLAQQTQTPPGTPPSLLGDAFGTLAGLPPAVLPGWLAALLSTVGEWINWPLHWLTWWIVYGLATLLAAKAWGAPTTLQRFYAVTSYAAVPLILTGLGPIPCLGVVARIVAVVWAATVYVAAVRTITGLDWLRALVAAILPAALVSLLGLMVLAATASTLLRMIF